MQEKVSVIVVRYEQKFPYLGLRYGITRQSLVMPIRDPRDGTFRLYLTPMKDTYIVAWLPQNHTQTKTLEPPPLNSQKKTAGLQATVILCVSLSKLACQFC